MFTRAVLGSSPGRPSPARARLAWAAAAVLATVALLGPGTAGALADKPDQGGSATTSSASTSSSSPFYWQGNGYPSGTCSPTTTGTMLWIWTGDNPTSLTINGQLQTSGSWVQQGNGSWHFTATIVPGVNYPPLLGTTYVDYTVSAGVLTLSGCNEGTVTSTTTEGSSSTTSEGSRSTTTTSTPHTVITTSSTPSTSVSTSSSTSSSATAVVSAITGGPTSTGEVKGVTGKPSLPPTTTAGNDTQGGGAPMSLILLLLAGALVSLTAVAPVTRRVRR